MFTKKVIKSVNNACRFLFFVLWVPLLNGFDTPGSDGKPEEMSGSGTVVVSGDKSEMFKKV